MSPAEGGPSFSVACVGDVFLQGPVASASRRRPGPVGPGCPALALLDQADLALGNLEAPLTAQGWPADKVACLRSDPALAGEVRTLGLDAVSVANNHALDYGPQGLLETLAALEKAGVAACGGGPDLEAALEPAWLEVQGTKVAMLGFCSALPPGFAATSRRPGIAPLRAQQSYLLDAVTAEEQPGSAPYVMTHLVEADVERACAAVSEARRDGAHIVVVQVHWGVPAAWVAPFQGPEMDYQRPLAHRLIDAGADVVAGHHPHAPSSVEIYRGKAVLYSLGNFLFHRVGRMGAGEEDEGASGEGAGPDTAGGQAAGGDGGLEGEGSGARGEAAGPVQPTTAVPIGGPDARPIPPYSAYAMSHVALGREHDGMLAWMEFQGAELKSLRLVALALDESGEPWLVAGKRSEAILGRVEGLSRRYAAGFRLETSGRVR